MQGSSDVIALRNDFAIVDIHPEFGAAIGRYDVLVAGRPTEVFKPDPSRRVPFHLGSNILLPFSNRISGGGFWHDGAFHPLTPNIDGNPLPTHGNAFLAPWKPVSVAPGKVVLRINSAEPGPFRYEAEIAYTLERAELKMEISVQNRAEISLPFGVGFHPWFVRTADTRLTMRCAGFWRADDHHLPLAYVGSGKVPHMDFSQGRTLPQGLVNNAFVGWEGLAIIEWPERGVMVRVESAAPLTTVVLYSPSADAGFFCLEPVSHSIDAHNRRDAGTAPPQVVASGGWLRAGMRISPSAISKL